MEDVAGLQEIRAVVDTESGFDSDQKRFSLKMGFEVLMRGDHLPENQTHHDSISHSGHLPFNNSRSCTMFENFPETVGSSS